MSSTNPFTEFSKICHEIWSKPEEMTVESFLKAIERLEVFLAMFKPELDQDLTVSDALKNGIVKSYGYLNAAAVEAALSIKREVQKNTRGLIIEAELLLGRLLFIINSRDKAKVHLENVLALDGVNSDALQLLRKFNP